MTTVVDSPAGLIALIGRNLGVTEWTEVSQERIALFAQATGDHQWIHVDVERARDESPFGGPIAHGYLTLSLVNLFLPELLEVRGASLGVNVGLGQVRFPAPVPSGARVRGAGVVTYAAEAKGGVQVTVKISVEVEGPDGVPLAKPACVAETISRFLP
ncbi:MAG: MaoC family dehydratase [Actinomycetota bacterium]